MRSRLTCVFVTLMVLVGAIHPTFADSPMSSNWSSWGYDAGNHRYNPNENIITPANVKSLRPLWQFVFPGTEKASVAPTVVDGTVYIGGWNGRVYAIDAATGKARWTYSTALTGKNGAVRASILVSGDLVLFGDLVGRFFALNKANGSLVWMQQNMDKHPLAQITGSPVIYGDRIYVPMSSREEAAGGGSTYKCCTFRGGLVALNIVDGSVAWHAYTVDVPQPTTKNSLGIQNYGPSGGAVWSSPAIDPDAGLIYLTTGNSYSEPNSPNSDAIMAISLTDGAVRWSKQVTNGDWYNFSCDQTLINCVNSHGPDVDFSSAPMLWTIQTPNGPRKLVGAAQKNGMYHALDALTGDRVWDQSIGEDVSFVWGASYDSTRVYVGDGTLNKSGGIYALDPATGAILWQIDTLPCKARSDQPTAQCWSGHMNATTTPGLLWMGAMDGQLRAIDSASGTILWTFKTSIKITDANGNSGRGGSIGPGGVTVANGQVYVASGYTLGGSRFQTGNVLFAFGVEEIF